MSWIEPPPPPSPTAREVQTLSELVWRGLREYLEEDPGAQAGPPPPEPGEGLLASRCGLFVTLRLGGDLRGCMGVTQSSDALATSVPRLARVAAGADPRFPPLRPSEVAALSAELTLLGPAVDPGCRGDELVAALRPGVHGARLRFGRQAGLLLPRVASDWGWTAREFLDHVAEKAGLETSAWLEERVEVEVFRALWLEAERP